MTIRGYWKDGYYVPEPSVQRFEAELAKIIAKQPCACCGQPLGGEPRCVVNKRQYHPQCFIGNTATISSTGQTKSEV